MVMVPSGSLHLRNCDSVSLRGRYLEQVSALFHFASIPYPDAARFEPAEKASTVVPL